MCQLSKFPASAMNGKVATIFLVLIFCFAECAAGSCLSYGHSCWGAHGKRSGSSPNANTEEIAKERITPLVDAKWLLSRLVQRPFELRGWKEDSEEGMKHKNEDLQLYNGNERSDDQDGPNLQDILQANDDVVYLDDPAARARDSDDRRRLLKLMKKSGSSARLN